MSVVVSIARGHDASYPFKTTGIAESPVITGQCGVGYYLSVVEKGGQPAGPRRFGFEWAHRPASKGRVIAGFPEIAIAQFSSRRAQITKTTLAVADLYEKDGRHAPGQREQASMGRFASAMTRRAKGPGALDFTALLRGWERASRVAELETLRDLAQTIWHATPRASALQKRVVTQAQNSHGGPGGSRRAGELTRAQERAVMAAGLARAQESRAGRCAARRQPRATSDATTRGRGWRLYGRSG